MNYVTYLLGAFKNIESKNLKNIEILKYYNGIRLQLFLRFIILEFGATQGIDFTA